MLDIALKEWAVVCDLLLEGRLAILLRKGGISEWGGPGVFRLEHPRFLLFPSWAHQKPEAIKPAYRDRVQVLAEPARITFAGYGQVQHIWRVPSRAAFDELDDLHCWTSVQVDMRFSYKPENPLYLLAVRACRLATPRTVANAAAYAGCVSWVPLRRGDEIDESAATPALSDGAFADLVARCASAMGAATGRQGA